MPPRPKPPRRPRASLAALALALGLWSSSSPAQQAAAPSLAQPVAPPNLGLRDGDSDAAAPLLPAPALDNPADQAQVDTDAEKKPPAPKTSKTKKPAKTTNAPPLALQPYRKAQRAGLPGGPTLPDPAPSAPAPSVAALPPMPVKHRPVVDDKPFDPTGVQLGDLKLLPTIEEDTGYASNPALLSGATKGSLYETTQAGVALQSDWARNELRGSLTGGYSDYFNNPSANNPNASDTLDGRFDVSHDLSFDGEGRFNVTAQTPGSVTLPTGVALAATGRPLVETYGATLGGAQKLGDLTLSLHGTLDRTAYQNATLADGSIEDLASDNFNDWGLRARAAYQISPVISPFIETVIDTRRYDAPIDYTGFARASNGELARAGATLAFTGQLTGEASLGYGERQYQDARLPELRAPLIDASLIWSVTPLTTVTAKTSTSLADTTNAGDSGAVSRSYTINVSHALLRNLTLAANAGFATDVYAGAPLHDSTLSFGASADYNLTRDIVLRASATHSQYASSAPGSSYIANVFMLGLRLQR